MKRLVKRALARTGYAVVNTRIGVEDDFRRILESCREYTQTTQWSMHALYYSVRYLHRYDIAGAIVECGVWKGGSAMLCALTLAELGDTSRDIYLFDTYKGMPAPEAVDVDHAGRPASTTWGRAQRAEHNEWNYAPLDEVRARMLSTGYPSDKLHFVEGLVEDTIPARAPADVALLRIDTDFYRSTRHTLEQLYPRLVRHGVLVLDDYGHFEGARRAADEYFDAAGVTILLNRIDHSVRAAVKAD